MLAAQAPHHRPALQLEAAGCPEHHRTIPVPVPQDIPGLWNGNENVHGLVVGGICGDIR